MHCHIGPPCQRAIAIPPSWPYANKGQRQANSVADWLGEEKFPWWLAPRPRPSLPMTVIVIVIVSFQQPGKTKIFFPLPCEKYPHDIFIYENLYTSVCPLAGPEERYTIHFYNIYMTQMWTYY